MSLKECAWCGDDITRDAVRYNRLLFCSAECRDDYQDDLSNQANADLEDMEAEFDDADLDELEFEDSDYLDEDLDDDLAYGVEEY